LNLWIEANFWGMFPPESRSDNQVSVVEINTMDQSQDDMTPNTGLCPALNELYLQLQNSSQWKVTTVALRPSQVDFRLMRLSMHHSRNNWKRSLIPLTFLLFTVSNQMRHFSNW
jgi:hypothetical protein